MTVSTAITEVLTDHRLGTVVPEATERVFGRNDNVRITVTDGRTYLVKQLVGGWRRTRVRRSTAYQRLVDDGRHDLPETPRCVAADEDRGILVFEHLDGAEDGVSLMVDETFHPDTARTLGHAVARLHAYTGPGVPDRAEGAPTSPDPARLAHLEFAHLRQLSGGEIRAWRLLQQDHELVAGLRELVAASAAASPTPVHGDLRADQVLVRDRHPVLIDWEEFRADDPARDVGAFAGEWLYRAVLDIPTVRGDRIALDGAMDGAMVVERGARKLAAARPRIEAFWAGYRAVRTPDPTLAARSAAFAGWHLLDRLLAGAATSPTLPAIQRAAAGIGRNAVLRPEAAVHTLGLARDHEEVPA